MKNLKGLFLSLAFVCLIAPAGLADGTIGTGGDRTSPTPTPPPATQSTAETEAPQPAAPGAEAEAGLAEVIQEALIWIASWAPLL
jgi:hypothetical protein